MKRFLAMAMAIIMFFSTPVEFFARENVDANSKPKTESEATKKTGGLISQQVFERDASIIFKNENIVSQNLMAENHTVEFDEWYKYASFYVYNQLSDEEKAFWDALDSLCYEALTTKKDYMVDQFGGCFGDLGCGNMKIDDALDIIWMFRISNPQYYFLSNGTGCADKEINTSLDQSYVALYMYKEFADGEDRAATTALVKEAIDNWVELVEDYASDEEKIRKFQSLICEKVNYNDAIMEDDMISTEEDALFFSQSAYSVFCTDIAVCAGYAEAMQILCNAVGIDAISATSTNHQWNKIRIDDSWYNVDVTWADEEDGVYYQWYGRSDASYYEDGGSHRECEPSNQYTPSATLDAEYTDYWVVGAFPTITLKVSAPVITVDSVGGQHNISIASATDDVTIYYTLDGTTPSPSKTKSYIYKESFSLQKDCKIKAIAVKNNYWDSDEVEKSCSYGTYSITYFLNGGIQNPDNPGDYSGYQQVVLSNPTRIGYTFGGWYSDSAFKTQVKQITKGSTGDKTLYAKWEKAKYTITYKLNGGKNSSSNPKTYDIITETIKLKNPTRKGYTFGGWYSDSKFKTKVTQIAKGSTGNKTLYAKWTKVKYTLTYKLDGGTNNSSNPTTYTIESETIKLKNPTKKGYTFGGWFSDSKFKTKVTKITEGSTGNKTLYAKWTANKYTIKFEGNGATSGKMSNLKATYDKKVTLTKNAFKRTGYKFVGWNTKKDGSGTTYDNKEKIKNLTSTDGKTVKLYAQWKKVKYTIKYVLNDGKNDKKNPSSYTVTTSTITLKKPTRKGYTFQGWYTDKKFKNKITKIKKGSTGDVKLYAKWKKNK